MTAERGSGSPGGDRGGDRPRAGIDEFVRRLLAPDGPLGHVALASLKQVVDFQILFVQAYKRVLDERRILDTAEEHLRETVKALLSAYVEIAQSFPARREELIRAHAETLDACVSSLEELKRRINEKLAEGKSA